MPSLPRIEPSQIAHDVIRSLEFRAWLLEEKSILLPPPPPVARMRSWVRIIPAYMLCMLFMLANSMTQAAPVQSDKPLDTARQGPYNITVQGGIAGAILIVLGLILCFFGVRFFRTTMFLIGFYFFGNIAYVSMANGGVTSTTLLLVISIVVGIIGGLLMVCCSRLGVAILGALAFYSLGLWILGLKSGGLIQSSTGRGIFLAVLAIVGFIAGFIREHEMVIIGSAIVGAYSFVAGVDFYAHTGFIDQTNSFINSKASIDNRVGGLTGPQIALLATFVVLALLGMFVQFRWWGRHTFRPAPVAGGNVVYTEKPSRFGGLFRRRRY